MRELLITDAPAATILVRIMTGSVFLSEGIQKFVYPEDLAAGRFAKIGIPSAQIMGPFVGGCEIVFGALLIVGLLTRLAAIALLIDISVAIVSTKIPVLLGHGFCGFFANEAAAIRFLEHDARGAYGFFHVAWSALSADRRRWSLVIRRGLNATPHRVPMADCVAINEEKIKSGAYGARTRNLRRDRAAL
jgi:putative oxidoreductase